MSSDRSATRGTINRPLSPHLQIYKFQLTSVMSITHRATGIALAVGTLLLVWWIVAAAAGPDAFASAQSFIGSWLGLLLLFGWSVSLFYHLGNGIRHLFWDAGYGFDIENAYRSGWLTLAATAALTVLAWIIGLVVLGGRL
jgi:succinate dehydrogenase / fumarate reductase, cytochrome b subunit